MPCFSEAWRSYIPFFILKFASGQSILVEFIKTHNIYITHTIMKKIFLSSTFLIMCALLVKAENLKLWYKQPATQWVEALPLGNSRLGAMVYGIPDNEEIQLMKRLYGEAAHTAMTIRKQKTFCQKYDVSFSKVNQKRPNRSWKKNSGLPATECLTKP